MIINLMRLDWERRGHGGVRSETNFVIYLNGFRCRGYSSYGNMVEGYWGTTERACKEAEAYAAGLAKATGAVIVMGIFK